MLKVFCTMVLLLFICCNSHASELRFFKDEPLFKEPIANPRSSAYTLGLTLSTSKYRGTRIFHPEGIIGANIPIVTGSINDVQLQFGMQASTWLTLGYNFPISFPLLTQDFHFGFPVSFKYGNWTGALKFNHISAHKGDGFDDMVEETLSAKEKERINQLEELGDQQGVGITIVERLPYSRDFISTHLSYDYNINGVIARSYVHMGFIYKIIPEGLGRIFIGSGTELKYRLSEDFTPFIAQDVTYNSDVDSVDLSIHMGSFIKDDYSNYFDFGVELIGYVGSDRRGQMLGRKMHQFGIGFIVK